MYSSQIAQSLQAGFNVAAFAEGARIAVSPAAGTVDVAKANSYLQNYFTREQQRAGRQYLEEGRKFLADNAKKPGVTTLPSGLQYRVIRPGAGAKPTASDEVEVMYHGTLIDGTVFDSAKQRGEPVVFPVSRVIPGFSEALQLMNAGAVWEIVIPSELGYGENGQNPIKPNSVLIFEIEVLRIVEKAPDIPQVEQNLFR
jgi:FKBP-type peptidyl-prolyl cis-trans isomerase FklB